MMAAVARTSAPRNLVRILGLPVDRLSMVEALEIIQGFLGEDRPHLIVTADSAGMVETFEDAELKGIYEKADLVTPDSIGVLWAAKRLGHPIPERVSGVDLVDKLCRLSADKGYRIFLLGAEPGVADLAAERLRLMHPGCNIVGSRHGYFPSESDHVVAQEVATFKPDILFVAMGIPRQEKFIVATQQLIGAKVAIGVGGSFDVFSGKAKRAPIWVQKVKLEWLWRTVLNPSKIKKAKNLPRFAWRVLRTKR